MSDLGASKEQEGQVETEVQLTLSNYLHGRKTEMIVLSSIQANLIADRTNGKWPIGITLSVRSSRLCLDCIV